MLQFTVDRRWCYTCGPQKTKNSLGSEVSSFRWDLRTGVLISLYPDQEGDKLQRQKILIFIYPIYNHNWRNISTIYIYSKTSIKRNIITIKQNTSCVCVCVFVHGTTYSVSQSTAEHSTIVHTGLPANDVHSKQHQGSHQIHTNIHPQYAS